MKDNLGSPKLRLLEQVALVLSLSTVALVACCPLLYASLQADDLCRTVRLSQNGILDCVKQDYLTFTGRWLGFGLEYAVLANIQGNPGYGMVLGGIAFIYMVAITFLIRTLFPQLTFRQHFLFSAGIYALYWVGLPSTKDSCYWLCGSVEYQLSLAFALITVAATICSANRAADKKPFQLYWLVAMLTAVMATGLHELFGLMLCIVMATGTLLAWKWRIAGKYVWLVVTGFAMAGFLFAFLAPGNAMRSANIQHSGDFLVATKVALATVLQTLPDWIFNFRLLLATLLLLACAPHQLQSHDWLNDERKRILRWVIPTVWIVLLAGAFFGPAWGTGQIVASRTLSATYMIFLIGWFLNWLIVAAWLKTNSVQLITLHPAAKTTVVILLAASLILTGNTRRVMRELAGPIPKYTQAKAEWKEILQKASLATEQEVILPRIVNPPDTIGFSDITADPENWINRCAAQYYGVKSVRVAKQ